MGRIIVSIFCFALLLFSLGCRKYPENTLWFKKPEKVFKGGRITLYTIDGIDKMQTIRDWYKYFPYNYYKQTDDIFSVPISYSGSTGILNSDYGVGTLKFSKSTKDVTIEFNPTNSSYGAQNIFVGSESWKVEKLTRDGQLKLQAWINDRTYVIQFN